MSNQSGLDPTGNCLEGSLQETMEEVNENALYCNEGCLKVQVSSNSKNIFLETLNLDIFGDNYIDKCAMP